MACDAAVNVENFLFHPVSVHSTYVPQSSSIGNWLGVFTNDGKVKTITINEQNFVADFEDTELLTMGYETIEPLLAEDWNSPEDDIWDNI